MVLDGSQPVERQRVLREESGNKAHGLRWGMAHLEPLQESYSVRKEALCPSHGSFKPLILQPVCARSLPESSPGRGDTVPACWEHPGHLPGWQLEPAGEQPAEPGSDCSRLLLRSRPGGKERRGAGSQRLGLPHLRRASGGARTGTSIFPPASHGEHLPPAATASPAWRT